MVLSGTLRSLLAVRQVDSKSCNATGSLYMQTSYWLFPYGIPLLTPQFRKVLDKGQNKSNSEQSGLKQSMICSLKCCIAHPCKIPHLDKTWNVIKKKYIQDSFLHHPKMNCTIFLSVCMPKYTQIWIFSPLRNHSGQPSSTAWACSTGQHHQLLQWLHKTTLGGILHIFFSFWIVLFFLKRGFQKSISHIICGFWHFHSHCLSKKKPSKYCLYKIYKYMQSYIQES